MDIRDPLRQTMHLSIAFSLPFVLSADYLTNAFFVWFDRQTCIHSDRVATGFLFAILSP